MDVLHRIDRTPCEVGSFGALLTECRLVQLDLPGHASKASLAEVSVPVHLWSLASRSSSVDPCGRPDWTKSCQSREKCQCHVVQLLEREALMHCFSVSPLLPGRKLRFVELCCPQETHFCFTSWRMLMTALCCGCEDDRHHTLRRDFGKFDEKRFNEPRSHLLVLHLPEKLGGTDDRDDRTEFKRFPVRRHRG